MAADARLVNTKQFSHGFLCQPYRFIFYQGTDRYVVIFVSVQHHFHLFCNICIHNQHSFLFNLIKWKEVRKIFFRGHAFFLDKMVLRQMYRMVSNKIWCGRKCGHKSKQSITGNKIHNGILQLFLLCKGDVIIHPALQSRCTEFKLEKSKNRQ